MKNGKYSVNMWDCHLNSQSFHTVTLFSMSKLKPQPIIVIVGPTGVGKTAMSFGVAKRFSAEIISMDSMQIYKHMDIGTAKATKKERLFIPHHLVDFVEPFTDYNTNTFVKDTKRVVSEIVQRGKRPMLVGGTGLYLQALMFGLIEIPAIPAGVRKKIQYRIKEEGNHVLHAELAQIDSESAVRIHINDTQRLIRGLEIYQATGKTWTSFLKNQPAPKSDFAPILIGLKRNREELYARIEQRIDQMIDEGLLDEVKSLLDQGYGPELLPMQAIGYKHMVQFCLGNWTWDEAVRLWKRDTRRFAKRQFTWFRDKGITWFHPDDLLKVGTFVEMSLNP